MQHTDSLTLCDRTVRHLAHACAHELVWVTLLRDTAHVQAASASAGEAHNLSNLIASGAQAEPHKVTLRELTLTFRCQTLQELALEARSRGPWRMQAEEQ
eukprot:3621335-Prymnesium_polylepis.1